jgi:hypothetical protein
VIKLLAIIAVGFVVALIVQHMSVKRAARRAEAQPPLTVTEEHGWTTIMTQPAPLPGRISVISWMIALAAGLAGALLGAKVDPNSPLPIIFGLAAWIGSGLLISKLFRAGHDANRLVQRKPFQVSSQGIRLPNGTLLIPGQIYGIRRGNTHSGATVVLGGVGVAAGVSQMAAVTAQLLTRVSYTVEIEHGGRTTVLAGGLTETQAHAVATEITRRLPGFQ